MDSIGTYHGFVAPAADLGIEVAGSIGGLIDPILSRASNKVYALIMVDGAEFRKDIHIVRSYFDFATMHHRPDSGVLCTPATESSCFQ